MVLEPSLAACVFSITLETLLKMVPEGPLSVRGTSWNKKNLVSLNLLVTLISQVTEGIVMI
jgi:hypothetical protein